jgi:hypothetical protein
VPQVHIDARDIITTARSIEQLHEAVLLVRDRVHSHEEFDGKFVSAVRWYTCSITHLCILCTTSYLCIRIAGNKWYRRYRKGENMRAVVQQPRPERVDAWVEDTAEDSSLQHMFGEDTDEGA